MATKTFKVSLSLDNPRIIQSGIKVRSFDKQSIKITIELTKNSQVYQIPTGAQIKISLLKLARQEQKIILDVPFTSAEAIDWIVPDYLDGYQGEVRVGIYLIVGTENIDVGYFNITSSVSDIDSAAEEFTESVLQGWAIEDLTALLPQFQAVLDETTGKDVISAPELIAARNGELNLKTRLDKEKQEVTAQLAHKANQTDLNVTDARIDGLIATSGDGTVPSELTDIRVGADAVTYQTAGEAVREQFNRVNTQLTETKNNLVEHKLDYIQFAKSGLGSLTTEKISSEEIESNSGIGVDTSTSRDASGTSAYGNMWTAPYACVVNAVKLHSNFTSTIFDFYAFDKDNNLTYSIVYIELENINGVVTLHEPIELDEGGYILVRGRNNNIVYAVLSTSTSKEYNPSTKALTDSIVRGGFDVIYQKYQYELELHDITTMKLTNFNNLLKAVPTTGEYEYIGRWFDKVIGGTTYKCTNADGSSILTKVSGALSYTLNFGTLSTPSYTPYFCLSIDGGDFTRRKITSNVVEFDDTEEHIIWIVIDGMGEQDPTNGKWSGTVGVYFGGITGGTKTAIKPRNRNIYFLGDSVTEGINALGIGANADVNSATNGFAFKTARKLNAVPLLCGYGGSGVRTNGSFRYASQAAKFNNTSSSVNQMEPDIVVINYGINDYAKISKGEYTAADFKVSYAELIDVLTVKYPGVPILCVVPFTQNMATEIEEVSGTKPYCYFVDTSGYSPTYTDTTHLDGNGAISVAEDLANDIIAIVGKDFFI